MSLIDENSTWKMNRRACLGGLGLGQIALAGLLAEADAAASPARSPLTPRQPHVTPRAKNVIFLFMYGGPSHMDTFEYKPELYPLDGKTIKVKTFGRGGKKDGGRVVGRLTAVSYTHLTLPTNREV